MVKDDLDFTKEQEYKVAWYIELYAESPKNAAVKSLKMMRDRFSDAVCFEVRQNTGDPLEPIEYIDLAKGSVFCETAELVQGAEYALDHESTLRYEQDASIQDVDGCYTIYKTFDGGELIDPIAVVQTYSQVELLMRSYGVMPF